MNFVARPYSITRRRLGRIGYFIIVTVFSAIVLNILFVKEWNYLRGHCLSKCLSKWNTGRISVLNLNGLSSWRQSVDRLVG